MDAYNNIIESREQRLSLRERLRKITFLRKTVNFLRRIKNFRFYRLLGRECRKYQNFFAAKNGLEVGGPTALFDTIYKKCASCDGVNFRANTVWWDNNSSNSYTYNNKALGRVYIADAVDMACIKNDSYDFVMSSNNLEHIANPIKALKEFYRVLKKGGLMIILVPMKEKTFDHRREYTTFEHLISDYENNTPETDLTHLPEIIELHDYELDPPCGGRESFIKRSQLNYENRCLHHHVFSRECLEKLFTWLGMQIIEIREFYGNYMALSVK